MSIIFQLQGRSNHQAFAFARKAWQAAETRLDFCLALLFSLSNFSPRLAQLSFQTSLQFVHTANFIPPLSLAGWLVVAGLLAPLAGCSGWLAAAWLAVPGIPTAYSSTAV